MDQIHSSKKRILGAIVFGFLVSGAMNKALGYTIPYMISVIKHLSIADANDYFSSATYLRLLLDNVYIFLGAGVAAYLARRKGIFVGVLSNIFYLLLMIYAFMLSIGSDVQIGGLSAQVFTIIGLLTYLISSILGGYYGQKIYDPEYDLDLNSGKVTIFGIRWFHYFWIVPAILYPFFSTALIALYAVLSLLWSYLYISVHISLWYTLFSIIYAFLVPLGIWASIYGTVYAFTRFFEIMRYKQTEVKGLKKFGKAIAFGILAPALFYTIAAFAAEAINNLPTPAHGDWKVGLIVFFGFYGLFALAGVYDWLKTRLAKKPSI